MTRKTEMSLFNVVINSNYKDRLLNQLSLVNIVHIKTKKGSQMKNKMKEKDPLMNIIKSLRQNLDNLLKKLNINDSDFQELKIKKDQRLKFVARDLNDLINQIYDEINFYLNRINELERYLSKAQIELENLKIIESSYVFLEQYQLNRESLSNLEHFNFKVFTTFSKNLENIESIFQFSAFPNVHQTDENSPNIYQLEDRRVFFIFYPRDQDDELKERINIIHAEEVPILKKYLTFEGINFTRIINEINIVDNTIIKYLKEKKKIRNQNLAKYSAINEVVQNIEEYNWAEHQFEEVSADRSRIKFYIPTKNVKKVKQTLTENLKEKIHIEITDVPKYHPTNEKEEEHVPLEQLKQLDMKSKGGDETKKSHSSESKQPDFREAAPTVMKNPFFIRPFEALTKMYGVPSYSEIDPTPFLAVTFPLLFGLMFGDIGHGMSLMIAGIFGGILFRKKEGMRNISWVIFYCGIGALLCGFLYGEFFGSNEILGYELQVVKIPLPLLGTITLHNPLDNIMSVFKFTLFIGVIHVNLGWIIQFMNYWKQSKKYMSLTDSFMKMCLLTGGTILIFTYGINLNDWLSYPYPILLVLVPGILLIVLKPIGGLLGISYLKKESFGSLLGEGTIETFETALSILSNIASYIRLLALSLAHIALMIAVGSLLDLLPIPGAITTDMDPLAITGIILLEGLRLVGIILGNAFVILLEGILVFINALRLHFYEFFFKFYQGSGTEFFPFYLDESYSIIQFWVDYDKDLISEEIEKEIDTKKAKEDLEEALQIINEKFF
ncbi:MAG: V-type ATP synthase subunit I [Promethearchaeota archaeon]